MEPTTKQDFYKEIDSRDLEKTGRIALVWRFFVCILNPWEDLYSFFFSIFKIDR